MARLYRREVPPRPPFPLQRGPPLEERKDFEWPPQLPRQTFEQEVLQSEKPVIVDFWAEWCGPCHAVSPVLDQIAEEREGELKLVKINVDEEQELTIRYGVRPSRRSILFKGGEPAAAASARSRRARSSALGLAESA